MEPRSVCRRSLSVPQLWLRRGRSASAGLLLLAFAAGTGRAEAAAGFGRRCPDDDNRFRSKSTSTSVEVIPTFSSALSEPVELFWLDGSGVEHPMGGLQPYTRRSMNSFSGHAWRARAGGRLVWEELLGEKERAPEFSIEECDAAPEELSLEEQEAMREAHEWLEAHGSRDGPALRGCPLATLLSEVPMRGLHVVCVVGEEKAERLCIFKDGLEAPACTHSVRLKREETLEQVLAAVAQVLVLPRPRPRAPVAALFSASGRELPLELSLTDAGVPEYRRALVLVEGGAWHWPPVRVGFVRPLHGFVHSGLGGITLRTLSLRPRILEVKSFIEDSECKRMLDLAGPKVKRSQVSLKDNDHGKAAEDWRTSFNYFLPSEGDAQLEALDERVQNLTRIPIVHSEFAQILRYDYWGRYTSHHDFFDPKDYSRDPGTLDLIGHGAYNRLCTVFMYMSDVEEGGETIFPSYQGAKPPVDFGDCTQGYKVRPERQKVIIFYNMHPNGGLDENSLHGGCRVINGTKWSANFWIWNVPRGFKTGKPHMKMAHRLVTWDSESDRREEAAVSEMAAAEAAAKSGEETLEL